MKTVFSIIFICLVFLEINCNSTNYDMEKQTVTELDIERYLGTWYEIARFDHRFERGLQGVTATYSKRKDGKITTNNRKDYVE